MGRLLALLVALCVSVCVGSPARVAAVGSGEDLAAAFQPIQLVEVHAELEASGFKWTKCADADGSFKENLAQNAESTLGEIPPGLNDVSIALTSEKDIDIRLYDAEDGTAIVGWPNGVMKSDKRQEVSYKGMKIAYSGYNGGGTTSTTGHEYIKIAGRTTRKLLMKVFGYAAGSCNVKYSAKSGCCCTVNQGQFEQKVDKGKLATVGSIPAGKYGLKVQLESTNDIDIVLVTTEGTYIVQWEKGILKSNQKECASHKGTQYCYSGYNGGQTTATTGNEWLEIKGFTTEELVLKVLGYAEGTAKVVYATQPPPCCKSTPTGEFTFLRSNLVTSRTEQYEKWHHDSASKTVVRRGNSVFLEWSGKPLADNIKFRVSGFFVTPRIIERGDGDWSWFMKDGVYTIKVPVSAPIGKYQLAADIGSGFSDVGVVYIIFNAWHKDDEVYMESVDGRNEYVVSDTGRVWYGDVVKFGAQGMGSMAWAYHQYELLDIIMEVLRLHLENMVFKPSATYKETFRGDGWHRWNAASAVSVTRALSWMLNSASSLDRTNPFENNMGVLWGRWDGNYMDGQAPTVWSGSRKIFTQWFQTKKPVKYGQCWVFSSISTTALRALGVPVRTVTTFRSAHDSQPYDGVIETKKGESIWNFHVWNDVWIRRDSKTNSGWVNKPDEKHKGEYWTAMDATPQESSHGLMAMGPAALGDVNNYDVYEDGKVTDPSYDAGFVAGETNAKNWLAATPYDGKRGWWSYKAGQDYDNSDVGRFISTKKIHCSGEGDRTTACRSDETQMYKNTKKPWRQRRRGLPSHARGRRGRGWRNGRSGHGSLLALQEQLYVQRLSNEESAEDRELLWEDILDPKTGRVNVPVPESKQAAAPVHAAFSTEVHPSPPYAGRHFKFKVAKTNDGSLAGKQVRVTLKAFMLFEDGTEENLPGDHTQVCAAQLSHHHVFPSVPPAAEGAREMQEPTVDRQSISAHPIVHDGHKMGAEHEHEAYHHGNGQYHHGHHDHDDRDDHHYDDRDDDRDDDDRDDDHGDDHGDDRHEAHHANVHEDRHHSHHRHHHDDHHVEADREHEHGDEREDDEDEDEDQDEDEHHGGPSQRQRQQPVSHTTPVKKSPTAKPTSLKSAGRRMIIPRPLITPQDCKCTRTLTVAYCEEKLNQANCCCRSAWTSPQINPRMNVPVSVKGQICPAALVKPRGPSHPMWKDCRSPGYMAPAGTGLQRTDIVKTVASGNAPRFATASQSTDIHQWVAPAYGKPHEPEAKIRFVHKTAPADDRFQEVMHTEPEATIKFLAKGALTDWIATKSAPAPAQAQAQAQAQVPHPSAHHSHKKAPQVKHEKAHKQAHRAQPKATHTQKHVHADARMELPKASAVKEESVTKEQIHELEKALDAEEKREKAHAHHKKKPSRSHQKKDESPEDKAEDAIEVQAAKEMAKAQALVAGIDSSFIETSDVWNVNPAVEHGRVEKGKHFAAHSVNAVLKADQEQWSLDIPAELYAKHLWKSSTIGLEATVTDLQTGKEVFMVHTQFSVLPKDSWLHVRTTCKTIHVGEEFLLHLDITNPLPIPMTHLELVVDGPDQDMDVAYGLGDVIPAHKKGTIVTNPMVINSPGKHHIMVSVDSCQYQQLHAEIIVEVTDSPVRLAPGAVCQDDVHEDDQLTFGGKPDEHGCAQQLGFKYCPSQGLCFHSEDFEFLCTTSPVAELGEEAMAEAVIEEHNAAPVVEAPVAPPAAPEALPVAGEHPTQDATEAPQLPPVQNPQDEKPVDPEDAAPAPKL